LDVSNWNIYNVRIMKGMFSKCPVQYIKKGNKLIKR